MTDQASEGRPSDQTSNRLLVQKFAAHLAHLLNEGEEAVEVRLFALYQRLLRTLAGAEAGAGARYREGLIGFAVVGADGDGEEVAQKYFDAVLDRPLHLARDSETHKGHELFLALCRRGLDPAWGAAQLARGSGVAEDGAAAAPPDFDDVSTRLARCDTGVSKSNPATTTRESHGPLSLCAGAGAVAVPEELSVWKAVSSCPTRLSKLEAGVPFNRFCSMVIKAVETANAPYGAILSLGLSPLDWGDTLTVNTAKKVSAFLNTIREVHDEDLNDFAAWQRVWEKRKVPGFKSVDDFWQSELGRAVRHPQVPRRVEAFEIKDDSDLEGEVLEAASFERMVDICLEDGVVDTYDAWFLRQLYEGATIAELAQMAETGQRLADAQTDIAGYVTELRESVLAHALRREAMEETSCLHPDKESEQPTEGRTL